MRGKLSSIVVAVACECSEGVGGRRTHDADGILKSRKRRRRRRRRKGA